MNKADNDEPGRDRDLKRIIVDLNRLDQQQVGKRGEPQPLYPSDRKRYGLSRGIPAIVVAMRVIGGLAILGGIILCIGSWPGNPPEGHTWKAVAYTPAYTWLFSGIISGTLFFAGGAALFYLDNIQEGMARILDVLCVKEGKAIKERGDVKQQ